MMVAAPEGWGAGEAANAWQNWFEPVGGTENLRHLLGSHATWLAEWPWPGRIAYVFGWAAIVVWALPKQGGDHADALAFFVAAFVLGLCNHVFLHPVVLALFFIGGFIVLSRQWFVRREERIQLRESATVASRWTRRLGAAALATLVVSLSLAGAGRVAASSHPVRLQSGWILAGDPTRPVVLVPWIDESVYGNKIGHAARTYLGEAREIGCLAIRHSAPCEPKTAAAAAAGQAKAPESAAEAPPKTAAAEKPAVAAERKAEAATSAKARVLGGSHGGRRSSGSAYASKATAAYAPAPVNPASSDTQPAM